MKFYRKKLDAHLSYQMSAREAEAREAAMESLQALIRGSERQSGDHATAGTATATGTRLRGGWASTTTEPGHTVGPSRAATNTAETQGARHTAVLMGSHCCIQAATAQEAPNQRGVSNLPTRIAPLTGHTAVAMDEAQADGTAITGTAHASETMRGAMPLTHPPAVARPPSRPPTLPWPALGLIRHWPYSHPPVFPVGSAPTVAEPQRTISSGRRANTWLICF